jgi:flagellar biogenesis protein FliO
MPDTLVIVLLIIGPLGIWLLMRFLNKTSPEGRGEKHPAQPEA